MRRSTALVAFCGVVGLVGAVNADSIDQADLINGATTMTGLLADGSATATAYDNYTTGRLGQFAHFTSMGSDPVAGVRFVASPDGDSLINQPEAISFDFANSVVVNQLNVAFLFGGVDFSDDEAATFKVTYADNSEGTFTLKPTSFNSASYSLPGATVTAGASGMLGEWAIADPFGAGRAVSNVTLLAADMSSNFGFESMSVSSAVALSPVAAPLPAAAWGGMALMGAMGAARMRKRSVVA